MEATNEIYQHQPDGSTILIKTEIIQTPYIKTDEELIKEKQDELLTIYNEILLLQNKAL
jgi:hypothetical protein